MRPSSSGSTPASPSKRWPRPEDWAPLVRDRLGLRLVQHASTWSRPARRRLRARALGGAIQAAGLELHSTFTGLAAYSETSCSTRMRAVVPQPSTGTSGRSTSRPTSAGARPAVTSAPSGSPTGPIRSVASGCGPGSRRTLDGLAVRARAAGLDYLLVENLAAAREPSTMAMIRDLLTNGDGARVPVRAVPRCRPHVRPGHDRRRSRSVRLAAAARGPVAPVIQLQQSDADGDHHWPFTTTRNAQGRIDADRVLAALAEGGVAATTSSSR